MLRRLKEAAHGALAIRAPDLSPQDRAFVRRYLGRFTMTSPERLIALRDAVAHIVRSGLPGAFVECGVWRGGSMMAVADTLIARTTTLRDLWLYDTFAGMSAPTAHDRDWYGKTGSHYARTLGPTWCASSLEEVRQNLARTHYPAECFHLIVGRVEDTIPATMPDQIALLRLDTDFYESTRHALHHLYPRLVPGGVLILDDYGYWAGARRAVDEYFASGASPVLLTRLDWSGRLAIKPQG